MRRRVFLAGVLALPVVTYFDMGASWKKNKATGFYGIDRSVHSTRFYTSGNDYWIVHPETYAQLEKSLGGRFP